MTEELQSANEQLQVYSEELQTLNEELRASNDELRSVNAELGDKVGELARANSDLKNLFDSTRIATLFLDEDLRVLRFTPSLRDLFRLADSDVGRPITDVAHRLRYAGLAEDVRRVLADGGTMERQVAAAGGEWYILRIGRYVTVGGAARGAVVTLVDVSELEAARRERQHHQEELARRAEQQEAVATLGVSALGTVEIDDVLAAAVDTVRTTLDAEMAKVLELLPGGEALLLRAGAGWHDGLVGTAEVPAGADSQAGYTLASAVPVVVEDLAADDRFRGPKLLTDHGVVSGLSVIIRGPHGPWGVFGVHTRRRRVFTRDDVHFLQAVANVVGAALERQRVAEELSASRHELTLKVAQERLRRAERLASIGTLAAGIAHEINNPVNSILVNAEAALLERGGDGWDTRAALERIVGEAVRCGRIVRDVLDFARAEHTEKTRHDLNQAVAAGLERCRRFLEDPPPVDLDLGEGLPEVLVSPLELEQVLVNLLRNAQHAARGDDLRVEIATRAAGGRARLTVGDNGRGMPPEIAARVFDPFFSTRRRDGGTGLGLSLVHSIVEEHGGTIDVLSRPGAGTTFVIELPPADEAKAAAEPAQAAERGS